MVKNRRAGSGDTPDGHDATALRTAVVRAADGDIDAFEQLVDLYQRPLTSLCHRMVRDVQDAEDIVQDTFLTAWKRLGTLYDPDRFKPWLYRLASNACIDLIRRRESRPSTPTDTELLWNVADAAQNPQRHAENTAALRDLETVLNSLPPDQKLTWILYEIHGETYAQIAEILTVSEGSVRGKIHRARRTIVHKMEGWL